jgi:hypothetical protein
LNLATDTLPRTRLGRIFSEVKIGRILIITVLIMGLVMYLPNLPVHIPGVQIPKLLNSYASGPSPNLVQKKTGQIMNGANSGTLAYTSNVVSGDTLIALQLDILPINSCASNCGATANTPTDTLGDTFSSIPVTTGSTCVVAPQGCFSNVVFWVATASSSASDTVSFSVTNANAAIMLSYGEIFEFNNVPSPLKKALTGNTGGSGVACGCMLATNLAITSGDFVIGGAADDGFASGSCAGAGSFLATPNATGWVTDQNTAAGSCQYFGSGHILNSTASPNQYEWIDAMTTHRNFAVGVLDLGLGSSPTFAQQPLKCTMFKVGPQANLTLGGSSNPIPATLPCDGSQHLVNVTSSAGAILDQSVSNSSNSRVTNQIGVIVNSIIIGDTLVIGAVGDLSSGTTSTITIVAPPGFYCPTNVANPGTSSSAAISIATCNKVGRGGTATWLASWTTNSCGLGSGCGYMSIYVYEFTGSSYSFLFSNGNNNATSTSTPHTNTVTLAGTDYLLTFDGVHSNKITQSAGSGFSLGTCYTTAITSTIFSCAETNSAGTTSTTFPFTLNASASWSDEGVAITGGITTMTLTEPADGGTTRDRFTGGVTTITLAPCSSGTCSSYNFTNYFQILKPLSYSVASGTPSGGTFPTITYSNVGGSVTTALSISSANIWIDNFTNAVPLNPWFSNLQDFFPNPDFNINNVTSQTIVYSSGGTTNCAGTNTTALFQNGTCFIPAIFWTFANVITPAGTYTLIFVFPESLAIFLKSRDMLLTFSVASLLAGTVNAATRSLPLYAVAIIVLIGGAMLAATFLRLVRKETVG